ncbi:hypothetical protein EJB05_48754 [Eragrostis curvula]|uniref:Uncharacterized protein n=1 Tax=Eragrostis curvula TaxID=38414 RepID=A0A5J9T2I1_9POAL|nr:hypothetical protein EJB05_48754 [Eragrostis curvula]
MEMAQERELLHQRQTWWPLDAMACSLETSSCSLFGWDPRLFYFGQGAIGNGASDSGSHEHHELEILVPKCRPRGMEFPVSEAPEAVTSLLTVEDAMAMPAKLDELLQNLLDSDEEGLSSWCALEVASAMSLFQHELHFGSVSATVPASPEKSLTPPQADLPSSSPSQGNRGPWTNDATSSAQCQNVGANCSSKRSAPAEKESEGGETCKRGRVASSIVGIGSSVARPFTVVKPGGADGEVTLADINKWILAPPARPVRHPVGEFACTPRVSAGNRPAPSGKTVAGFTRVRTAGRGSVTVVRTIG